MKIINNFYEVFRKYLLFAQKQQKKQSFYTLEYNFNERILPFFKDYCLEDITKETIISWEDYILSFNFSNNYNKSLYYFLSSFFTFCHKYYGFDKSIISDVGCFRKKYEVKKVDFYTSNEFFKFIKYVDDPVYRTFFSFMFFTGTRPGEAMALKFSDINGFYVSINKTISSHGSREIGTPKTFSSNRSIKIDKFLFKDILKLKKYYDERFGYSEDLYVFGGIKPLSPTTINRRKIDACNKANLRPITLHQFRHSHATMLVSNGIMINEVSRRLGHSKVSTTLDIYTHSDLSQEKRVVSTLSSIRLLKKIFHF